VQFKLHITDGRGAWSKILIDYGDGSPGWGQGRSPLCVGPTPGQPAPPEAAAHGSDDTFDFQHAYRRPGAFTAKAHVETTNYCSPDPATEVRDVTVTVNVLPGPEPSNGPSQPSGFLDQTSGSGKDPAFAYTYYTAGDDDGYVSRVSLDWGDGTAPDVIDYPLTDCHDPGTYWPRSLTRSHDGSHQYAGPGTYTARLTVTSVGCDGKDQQTSTTEARVTYPSPPSS